MFRFFKAKTADVLSHWYAPVPNFNTSTQEFYTVVEKEITARKVPDLKISRVEFFEEGFLSAKREYLRMTRERLVFDICACPFGTSYFFSCRFGEVPPVVQMWQLLILFGALCLVGLVSFFIFAKVFGGWSVFLYPLAWVLFFALAFYVLRNAKSLGLDAALISTPLINAIYEAWFQRETYYRQDTRLMYYEVVNEVVKAHVEEVTSAQGIKLVRFKEYSPILGELYKPTQKEKPEAPKE